jgi:hypothetical protein
VIGQFTLAGSANLMFLGGTLFGVAGGGLYVALRGRMVGPRWFQVLSISLGPAVVAGAGLVHTGGVDFTLLEPLWLAVALFVAIPGVFAAALTLVSEPLLARDRPLPTRCWRRGWPPGSWPSPCCPCSSRSPSAS